MATIPPFVVLDFNRIPENGPSLAAFPPPLAVEVEPAPISLTSGFSGIPIVTGGVVYRFGSLTKYSFSITGLTAADGANVAQLALPLPRLNPFFHETTAWGSLSAISDSGYVLTGKIRAIPGGSEVLLTLTNDSGFPKAMENYGLQGMVAYHLI